MQNDNEVINIRDFMNHETRISLLEKAVINIEKGLNEIKHEIHDMRRELRSEIKDMKKEMNSELKTLCSEINSKFKPKNSAKLFNVYDIGNIDRGVRTIDLVRLLFKAPGFLFWRRMT